MSIWKRITRLLPGRTRPIGHDLAGNTYFELPAPTPHGRPKRVVEYADARKIDYRKGTAQLPVQWTAWLSFTRDAPPSMAELRADAARRERLAPMVRAIEEREREERIQQGYLLPDGTEPGDGDERVQRSLSAPTQGTQVVPPWALDAEPSPSFSNDEYIAPPREKVDPTDANSAEKLRALAEEDTKRRLKESGVVEPQKPVAEGVEGVGSGFKPRRRG